MTKLHLNDHQANGRVCGLDSDQIFERLSKLQHLWIDQAIELQLGHFSRAEASKFLHRLLVSPDNSLKCSRLEWNMNHITLPRHMMKSLPETFLDFKFPIHEYSALRRIKELKFQDGTYVTADDLLTYLSLLEDDGIDDQIFYIRFFVERGSKPPPSDYLPLNIQSFVSRLKEMFTSSHKKCAYKLTFFCHKIRNMEPFTIKNLDTVISFVGINLVRLLIRPESPQYEVQLREKTISVFIFGAIVVNQLDSLSSYAQFTALSREHDRFSL
ncbi:hypothetical protein Ddc_10104 [Ditylenchus destructor]|nr:hypothetical protein Ddc_10104 [Ditylenchus destructor]